MSTQRTQWYVFFALLTLAVAFRVSVAHWLANNTPDDAKVYSQLARNMLEQHVYSDATQAPFPPTFIRTPGYPLSLAFLYSLFGHANDGAVRIVQAVVDSATCVLVALFASLLQAEEEQRAMTALIAMALAAANPFTTIYTATILPEVLTTFLGVATCVVGVIALRTEEARHSLLLWGVTGLLAGASVLVRPDSGLFAAAIGMTLIVASLFNLKKLWRHAIQASAVCFLSFALVLLPWTIRNWRTFHLFQPLAPMTAMMPNEFFAHGYSRWLQTWLDDERYVDQVWWALGERPISIKEFPDKAFDSPDERERVAALLDKYNHPAEENATNSDITKSPESTDKQDPSATSGSQSSDNSADSSNGEGAEDEDENSDSEDDTDQDSSENNSLESQPVEMTPEIDAGFAKIAAERIARAPLRFYLRMPIKRSAALWLNTHSDYYPFSGDLFPLSDLDYDIHQHVWLPLFAALVGFYTLVGMLGGVVLWLSRSFFCRMGLLLVAVIFVTRFALFSTTESLESRYVVELFPFLAALGGVAIARMLKRRAATQP